jgi:hypothetical protein
MSGTNIQSKAFASKAFVALNVTAAVGHDQTVAAENQL